MSIEATKRNKVHPVLEWLEAIEAQLGGCFLCQHRVPCIINFSQRRTNRRLIFARIFIDGNLECMFVLQRLRESPKYDGCKLNYHLQNVKQGKRTKNLLWALGSFLL